MSTLRPLFDLLLARKPCLLFLTLCEGWYSDPYVTLRICCVVIAVEAEIDGRQVGERRDDDDRREVGLRVDERTDPVCETEL